MNRTAANNTAISPHHAPSRPETIPKRPLRVVHVVHWPISGIVSLLKNLIPCLSKNRIESHIIFFHKDASTLSDFSQICSSVHSLDLSHSYLGGLVSYRRLLKQLTPDIVHFHSFQPMLWGSLFSIGGKQLCTVHSNYPYFHQRTIKAVVKRTIQKLIFKKSGMAIVAVSQKVGSVLARFNIPSERLHIINNGIPLDDYHSGQNELAIAAREINRGDKDIIFITIGRMDQLKGYPYLLQAFHRVLKTRNNIRLLFIGDGPERKGLAETAEELGIEGYVRFLGFKKDPRPYLSLSDIYICSSVVEGWSLAVAEAMFSGLPVVATRVGANPDIIDHGVNGLLVEPGNSAALARAMEEMISRRTDWAEMGKKARAIMLQHYNIQNTADAYTALYAEMNHGVIS